MATEEIIARLDDIESACRRLRSALECAATEPEHEDAGAFAARRGVSVFTVRRWCKHGMPHTRPNGHGIRIPIAEACRWLDSGGRVVDIAHAARAAARRGA